MSIQDVISVDKEILGGTPVFQGTRVPVKNLLDYIKAGYDVEEFLDHFPSVTKEQILHFLEVSGKEYLVNHYHENFT